MAHRNVEILIGRLVTDEAFRRSFLRDAGAAIARFAEAGYELTSVEIAALQATHAELWSRVAEQIDPRLQRAAFRPAAHR